MANPKGNEATLVKYQPKWRSGKTRTIRVPIAISDLVLEAAREIDVNGNKSLVTVIKELKEKIKLLEAGSAVTSDSSQLKENSKQPHPKDGDSSTDTSETEILTNEDRVIRGKISEVVAILQHGITPKSQGGVYRSNNGRLLKEEVIKAIAILGELTGNRVIHGKISEVVVILQHGITSKKQGGVYRSNSPYSLGEEVVKAITILEELTGLD